ncbi:hypothetical protein ACWDBO_35370 [Streptomyces mirabilis]|uniref:hypothetical protein n=1 Tax=Streptomyces TaxID=1883 RepID=UPI0029B8675D|nr:hypothetical protein [Streptomyces sp. AK02-04a]MDX3762405.1 hypothetical protein [Streptomyces sp. AK02-04a]
MPPALDRSPVCRTLAWIAAQRPRATRQALRPAVPVGGRGAGELPESGPLGELVVLLNQEPRRPVSAVT